MLEQSAGSAVYKFTEGPPVALNRLLREGILDISPSSSIEYLRHRKKYILMDGHSVSAAGHIGSISLFSKIPIEKLGGLSVLTSSKSATSAALLEIILKKFYNIDSSLKVSEEPLSTALESYPAYLLIGDDALAAVASYKLQVASKNSSLVNRHSSLYVYDLGEIWHKHTGLPFVFALWIARRGFCEKRAKAFESFKKVLDIAKNKALENLPLIAGKSALANLLSEDEIISYWQNISYDLTEKHKKGLELFRKYAEELRLL